MKTFFKISFLILYFLGSITNSQAQFSCGTDLINQNLLKKDTVFAQSIKVQLENWKDYKETPITDGVVYNKQGVLYEIPVVFHIIHTGEAIGAPKNPSDKAIDSLLTYLNEVFASTYASHPDTNNGGVYIPIKFVLAKKDPNCDSASGINRVDGTVVKGYETSGIDPSNGTIASDISIKNLSRWDPKYYMNIWIVTKIYGNGPTGNGIAGYATFPGASESSDGIVFEYDQTYWAIAHEVGHYFGLRHTFQGSANDYTCPPNNDCNTDGDLVCDTDPHALLTNCPTGNNPCNNTVYGSIAKNIMSYFYCNDRFTSGQKERMIYMLTNYRANLLNSFVLEKIDSNLYFKDFPINACKPATIITPNNKYDVGPRAVYFSDLKYSSLGYTNDNNQTYKDNTKYNCLEKLSPQIAHIYPYENYEIKVTTGYTPENTMAWIDYNNDGDFQNSELILNSSGTKAYENHIGNINVQNSFVSCKSLRMRIVSDYYLFTTPTACGGDVYYGQTEDFIVHIFDKPRPVIDIKSDMDSLKCLGMDISFTNTIKNKGLNTKYFWFLNDSLMSSDSVYHSKFLEENDSIYCKIISDNSCNPSSGKDSAFSNLIIISYPKIPASSITILADTKIPVCKGSEIVFTANIKEGRKNQKYQWFQNQIMVGGDSSIFRSKTINDQDSIYCKLIQFHPCKIEDTAFSNFIFPNILALNDAPKISLTANINNPKPNEYILFTSKDSNVGTTPFYSWFKNGNIISGANYKTYYNNIFTDGDAISVMVKSSIKCASPDSAISNQIVIDYTAGIITQNIFGEIQLFPNPNQGIFTIKGLLLKPMDLKIQIVNMLGQQIYEGVLEHNNQKINQEIILKNDLPNGVYIFKLMNDESSQNIKFFLEK